MHDSPAVAVSVYARMQRCGLSVINDLSKVIRWPPQSDNVREMGCLQLENIRFVTYEFRFDLCSCLRTDSSWVLCINSVSANPDLPLRPWRSVYATSISCIFPKRNLRLPGHQVSWVSGWIRHFSPWASSAVEATTETKFGTKVARG